MLFLIDAQLPPALVHLFREFDQTANHVYDVNLLDASDEVIWAYALKQRAVIVSKDEDFTILVQTQQVKTPVVWIRIGNCGNRTLTSKLKPIMKDLVARLQSGEVLIEIV
jgi:predicted nuclease of predicted toxin-antitoxin system